MTNQPSGYDPTYLGRKGTEYQGNLDLFPIPTSVEEVTFTTEEFTAFCPYTGQADFYTLIIRMTPNGQTIETKSLKLYLSTFRQEGIFGEHLADKIAADIYNQADPYEVEVTLKQGVRGGLKMDVVAIYPPAKPVKSGVRDFSNWHSVPAIDPDFSGIDPAAGEVQDEELMGFNLTK